MASIEKLKYVREEIKKAALKAGRLENEITLIVVSKKRPIEALMPFFHAGCLDFGENRIGEALDKMQRAPNEMKWHFIGRIQKNKVSKLIDRFSLIHSVDQIELAKFLSDKSVEKGVVTPILLQCNTSFEPSKTGLSPEEWKASFDHLLQLKGTCIKGLMTMAPYTHEEMRLRSCFSSLRHLKEMLEKDFSYPLPVLSMGMSNDFPIAIEEGATHLRIGTALFD